MPYDDLPDNDEETEPMGCLGPACMVLALVFMILFCAACSSTPKTPPPPHVVQLTTPDGKVIARAEIQQPPPGPIEQLISSVAEAVTKITSLLSP